MAIKQAPYQDIDIPLGTNFMIKRPEYTRNMTVVDVHKTYDFNGVLVKTRYVCDNGLSKDYDVCKVTIQKALMNN